MFVVSRGSSIRLTEERMESCLNPMAIDKINNLNFLAIMKKLNNDEE